MTSDMRRKNIILLIAHCANQEIAVMHDMSDTFGIQHSN